MTTASSSLPPQVSSLTTTTATTTQQRIHPASTGEQVTAGSSQPPPSTSTHIHVHAARDPNTPTEQHRDPPSSTSSALANQITAMAISPPQLPPSSSHQFPASVNQSGEQSYVSGNPSASSVTVVHQHGRGYPAPSPAPPPPPTTATGQIATTSTMTGSSHPPSIITAQCFASHQSHVASPDASIGQHQHHYHHHGPPPPPPTSSNTGQIRQSFPPHPQQPPAPPNFTNFGPPQPRAPLPTNPGTAAMSFRQHGHQLTTNQSMTTVPSRVPPSTYQHPPTTSYAAPRGSTGQRHAIPSGYLSSHPKKLGPMVFYLCHYLPLEQL